VSFEALADPVRREIVEMLADGEVGAGDIAARFPVSRPAISRHLRVLREAGLVHSEVRGQHRVYRLDRGPLADLDTWLERFRPLDVAAGTAAEPAATEPGPMDPDPDPDPDPPRAVPGPAGRLDALDTEIRRGRRERRTAAPRGHADDRHTG
jgi:DNA-binding transcriptional ArsR family regulator